LRRRTLGRLATAFDVGSESEGDLTTHRALAELSHLADGFSQLDVHMAGERDDTAARFVRFGHGPFIG